MPMAVVNIKLVYTSVRLCTVPLNSEMLSVIHWLTKVHTQPHSEFWHTLCQTLSISSSAAAAAISPSSSSLSSVICQTTGAKPIAKRFLHILRSRASSFNSQYPLLSLRSSSNCLCLLPCLLVTSICPFIFPSITCFRRQFLRKM